MKYDDLSPRGQAFVDAYHADDPDEMERVVRDQLKEEFEEFEHQSRKSGRILFFIIFASLGMLALIVSRWLELQ